MEKRKKIVNCFVCGKETTRSKFCSHACKMCDYQRRRRKNKNKCAVCGNFSKHLYCSKECQKIVSDERINWNICLNCGEKTLNRIYCSVPCKNEHSTSKPQLLTCKFCEKQFESFSSDQDYCSTACKERQFWVNEDYFDGELDSEKLETLGQIIAIGQIDDETKFKLKSDKQTLDHISKKLDSTYPLKELKTNWSVTIVSNKLTLRLLDLGLTDNRLKQEIPPYDIIDGMFKTHRYKKVGGGWNVFRTLSAKIAYELEWRFGGKITTKTYYTNITQEELGVEFFLVWNDDPLKHSRL